MGSSPLNPLRLVAFIVSALLATGASSAVARGYEFTYVAVDIANVRVYPGPEQEVLFTVEWGEKLLLDGWVEGWHCVIQASTGRRGWIAREMVNHAEPTRDSIGTWTQYSYAFHRDRNVYSVTFDPSLPGYDSTRLLAMRAVVDSIYGESGTLDLWPEEVSGSQSTLYRVPRDMHDYLVVLVRDAGGDISGFLVWRRFQEAAG